MRSACNLENHCCDLNVTIKRTGEYNNWYMIYIGLLGITYSLSYRMTTLELITFEIFYLLWCTDLKLVNIINLFWFLSVIVFLILLLIFNLIFFVIDLTSWLSRYLDTSVSVMVNIQAWGNGTRMNLILRDTLSQVAFVDLSF